jgi:hypothetical protein
MDMVCFSQGFLTLFWEEPEPGTEHIAPPRSTKGYWILALIGFAMTVLVLLYIWQTHRVVKQGSKQIIEAG